MKNLFLLFQIVVFYSESSCVKRSQILHVDAVTRLEYIINGGLYECNLHGDDSFILFGEINVTKCQFDDNHFRI